MQMLSPLASSYRDNDGFVFKQDNVFYRLIKSSYFLHYEKLMQSGLYDELTKAGRLVAHAEMDITNFNLPANEQVKIILPDQIPFISYPYEWSFDMWRDAAIVTLKIAAKALEKGMILKDATPFNIQFVNGRPVFIDTLSFEILKKGDAWIAYQQFCLCFLGPLLLMHYNHRDFGKLFQIYPDGIPMDIVKAALPFKSKLNIHVYMHIWMKRKKEKSNEPTKEIFFSSKKMNTLFSGLIDFVKTLSPNKTTSTWEDYYTNTILGNQYIESKKILIEKFVEKISFKSVIDLGANDGYFSLLLKDKADFIVAADFDSNCINELYKKIRKDKIKNIVPIVSTLNNPSPAIGWNNEERNALPQRLKADLTLALALVHHLAISVNVPLSFIAKWMSNMGPYLIIEFVPKSDEKVIQLLKNREDIFDEYTLGDFKKIYALYYEILAEEKVGNTDRVLFLMKRS
jgi:hypothetical protein